MLCHPFRSLLWMFFSESKGLIIKNCRFRALGATGSQAASAPAEPAEQENSKEAKKQRCRSLLPTAALCADVANA